MTQRQRAWRTKRAWTATEIETERERLDRDAASILGYMLFEYSRLDMQLGLMVVWTGDGQKMEKLTTHHNESNFLRSSAYSIKK